MTRPRPTALAALALAAAALTGCGANLDAQTYQERNQAESTDTAVGALAIRDLAVVPPEGVDGYAAGDDAEGSITVTNNGTEPDRLVSVSSPDAAEVVVLEEGSPSELEVPALGSTASRYTLRIEGLKAPLRAGEFIRMAFRFEKNGSVEALVPVEINSETAEHRPEYGEEGPEEGSPALQHPTGGHGEEH